MTSPTGSRRAAGTAVHVSRYPAIIGAGSDRQAIQNRFRAWRRTELGCREGAVRGWNAIRSAEYQIDQPRSISRHARSDSSIA